MSRSAVDLSFRPARPSDAAIIDAGLRAADRAEIEASSGPDTLSTLRQSIAMSIWALTFCVDARPVAVFGVVPLSLLGGVGAPWLLATDELDQRSGPLTRGVRTYLPPMLADFPHLVNYVDARNTRSVRWLRRLGFTIHPATLRGVAGLPFHRFEMKVDDHV